MSSTSSRAVARAHSRVANATKKAKKNPAARVEVDQARRELAEAKLAAYIAQVVEAAPPLSAEAAARLTMLLHGSRQ